MKKLMNLVTLSLIMLFSISSFARNSDLVNYANPSVNSLKQINEYKVRIIIHREPDPSTTLNEYKITTYIYADNDPNVAVAIPSPIEVEGNITWDGGSNNYPLYSTIPTSGVNISYQQIPKPDVLTANEITFVGLSTNNIGGIPVVFDQIVFD
jgi:hypothetical protein